MTTAILLTLITLIVGGLIYGVQMAKKNGTYLKEDPVPEEFRETEVPQEIEEKIY